MTTGGPNGTPRPDLGIEVVNEVRRRAEGAELRCVVWPRGFSWKPLAVNQRIWSEPDLAGGGTTPRWRLQVRSSIAAGFEASPAQLRALLLVMRANAVSGVVRNEEDRTRLELASTVHVHTGNAHRAADLVGVVACVQAAQVERLVWKCARAGLRVAPELTQPAHHLLAETPRPGTAKVAGTTSPFHAVAWPAEEMRACVDRLVFAPRSRAMLTPQGLTASFGLSDDPLVGRRALLQLDTTATRPGFGPGLSVVLVAPDQGGVREALALNERELLPGCETDLLGGWVAAGTMLHHAAFYPDALYREGLLTDIVETAVRRVESVMRPRRLPEGPEPGEGDDGS